MKKKYLFSLFLVPFLVPVSLKKEQENKLNFINAGDKHVIDEDWSTVAGTTKSYIGHGDETYFLGLTSSGQHGYYKYKVHFDGLDITWREENLPPQSTMSGFYFSQDINQYYGNPSFSVWKGLYSGQTRVHVGKDHDYNSTSYCYSDSSLTSTGFSVANSMVMTTNNEITHAGFRVQINSYNERCYKLVFSSIYDDSPIWSNNANYKDGKCTVYLPKTKVDCLDSNGDCYIQFYGFDTNAIQSGFIPYVSITDNNKRAYIQEKVNPVESKLFAYTTKMAGATSVADFKDALELRETYLNSLDELREHDKYVYSHEKLEEADASVASVAAKYANEEVEFFFDKVDEDIVNLTNEDNNTLENIETFEADVVAAKEVYENYKNLLLEEQRNNYESLIELYAYKDKLFLSLNWVITLERELSSIPAMSGNAAQKLDEIYDYYLEDASRDTIKKLTTEDEQAINTRILNDKNTLDQLYVTYRGNVIDNYLRTWNSYLGANLSNEDNLVAAIDYYKHFSSRIEINEKDNKYATFTEYFNKLVNASNTFVNNKIDFITGLFDEEIALLDEYQPIKDAFHGFNIEELLFIDNPSYEELMNKYNQLESLLKTNPLYFFDAYLVDDTQIGRNGIYFESVGAFPNRINYNQPLSISEGIDIEMVIEEYAFYNDGRRANNISFNFLNVENSYKNEMGISFVIWVYEKNSNVKLYNLVDGEISACSITTPKPGQPFRISLKSSIEEGKLIYTLKVNDGTLKFNDEYMKMCGININNTTYFSLGSFLDDVTYTNSISIRQINDKNFMRNNNIVKEDNPDMK